MLLAPFLAPKLKVDRANKHFDELIDLIASYQAEVRAGFMPVADHIRAWTFEISAAPPAEIMIIFGEIAYSLRAALDVMLCDIARLRDERVNDISFPFADSRAKWVLKLAADNRAQPWKKVGADVTAAIDRLKPYRGGNTYLRGLYDLNNMDKHKIVCLVAAMRGIDPNMAPLLEYQIRKIIEHEKQEGNFTNNPNVQVENHSLIALTPGRLLKPEPDHSSPTEPYLLDTSKLQIRFPRVLPDSVLFANQCVLGVAKGLLNTVTEIVEVFRVQFGRKENRH